jgi:hypothetical protein
MRDNKHGLTYLSGCLTYPPSLVGREVTPPFRPCFFFLHASRFFSRSLVALPCHCLAVPTRPTLHQVVAAHVVRVESFGVVVATRHRCQTHRFLWRRLQQRNAEASVPRQTHHRTTKAHPNTRPSTPGTAALLKGTVQQECGGQRRLLEHANSR